MRISFRFKTSAKNIQMDYRSGFLSLLKKSFEIVSPDIYNEFYNKNTMKPFTFSVYFGNEVKFENGKLILKSDIFYLNFSTLSLEIGTKFYNGLIKIKRDFDGFPFYHSKIYLENVQIKKEKEIKDNIVVFNTLSPFLVRDYENRNKYLIPTDNNFQKELNRIVSNMYDKFLCKKGTIEFKSIRTKNITMVHIGTPVVAIKGIFTLKGDKELLNLIYKVGLGSRRSQGFGMLEVIG